MKNLKVLGVCAGQGALLFPFRKHLIANIEPRGCFHTPKEEQWKLNFGDTPFLRCDNGNDFGKVDILLGNPDCGHSSILSYSRKKTLGKPKENISINLFMAGITKYQPKIFLMENLPKLLEFITLKEWENLYPNYKIITHCHSVSEFGNPQISRKRLILMGIRKGQASFNLDMFTRIYKLKQLKSTRELLESTRLSPKLFPMNGDVRELESHKVCMYDYRDPKKTKLSLKEIRKLWVGDFSDCYKWPINSPRMKTLPGVYRNKEDRAPMTARKADRQFRPDGVIMSPGELAVIQGFPNKFKLYLIDTQDTKIRNYWINKARVTVTKGPSYEIGKWLKRCLKSRALS